MPDTVFGAFEALFPITEAGPVTGAEPWHVPALDAVDGYADFAQRYAGTTFDNGLYRVHDASSAPLAHALLRAAFPEFSSRAVPFGYDWLGRQFAVDAGRLSHDEPLVLMFETGTGEALEVPYSFKQFHQMLDEVREPALADSFFRKWAALHPETLPLQRSQCVAYRIPLFLGGSDGLENLELADLDVYWTLFAQLRQQTRGQPPGTRIRGVSSG